MLQQQTHKKAQKNEREKLANDLNAAARSWGNEVLVEDSVSWSSEIAEWKVSCTLDSNKSNNNTSTQYQYQYTVPVHVQPAHTYSCTIYMGCIYLAPHEARICVPPVLLPHGPAQSRFMRVNGIVYWLTVHAYRCASSRSTCTHIHIRR